MKLTAAVATLLLSTAAAVAWWRFDRRAARLVVLEAQRIADDESARLLRMGHPSMWGTECDFCNGTGEHDVGADSLPCSRCSATGRRS